MWLLITTVVLFPRCLPQNDWYSYSNAPPCSLLLPKKDKNIQLQLCLPQRRSELATAFEITHHTFTAAADKPIIFARLSPGDALRAFERVSAATAVAARVRCSYCAAERRTLQQNRIITQGFHVFWGMTLHQGLFIAQTQKWKKLHVDNTPSIT